MLPREYDRVMGKLADALLSGRQGNRPRDLPDRTMGAIHTFCRCCGLSLRVPEEDALDLCAVCLRGKGGDTNKPCSAHPGQQEGTP